ncbi:hypothetical protein Patl1_12668 [Pistacia atlantica]|uniref:Uncharacterized protein n=1 Tax=Pistacia atlantica TaxID=434234 RepID=A0ACC1AX70_9ROSI|nr:hypothetical protein Patl1_12668 [Pistacia atlantica]
MESFNDLYRIITRRITTEALKERVLKVLQVWSDWFLFSDAYVNGLQATFLWSRNSGVTSFHSINGARGRGRRRWTRVINKFKI